MITLTKQEFYKLFHKKSTYACTLLILLYMTAMGIASKIKPKFFDPKNNFTGLYGAGFLIVLFMIAACSSIIAMEFQYGTIKQILYRKYSRSQILFSKWITMFIYSLYFYAISFIYTILLKTILYNDKFKLTDKYINDQTIIQNIGINLVGDFINLWLVLSLVLLLTNIFKTSAAAITVGIIGYFATAVVNGIQFMAIHNWNWVKWNPINMMNLPGQMIEDSLHKMTQLSTPELVYGNFAYIIIFMVLSYFAFNKRNV